MFKSGSLSRICRVCNKETDETFNIFQDKLLNGTIEIFQMLQSLHVYNVHEDDQLPPSICKRCSQHLVVCYSFINLWKKSTIELQELLKYAQHFNKSGKTTDYNDQNIEETKEQIVFRFEETSDRDDAEDIKVMKRIFCQSCNKGFRTSKALQLHTKITHKEENPIKSEQNIETKDFTNIVVSNPNIAMSIPIMECESNELPETTFNVSEMQRKQTEFSSDKPIITCTFCYEEFLCNTSFLSHWKLAHKSSPKITKDSSLTNRNVKPKLANDNVPQKQDEKISCPHCSQMFLTIKGLTLHKKITHESKSNKNKEINYD